MSLYYDAAPLLLSNSDRAGSFKSRVFNLEDIKSSPKQVYALVSEASKWSPVLKEVIERSQLLQHERKLTPNLALPLVHDLLLNKQGISTPASHPLRASVEKHKARLGAEFTRARLRRGLASIEEFRAHIEAGDILAVNTNNGIKKCDGLQNAPSPKQWTRPRWVRVNTLKTGMEEQLNTTFAGYKPIDCLRKLLDSCSSHDQQLLHLDKHVPNLLALPHSADISKTSAYLNGQIILQDKASCFPAYLLNPRSEDGDCVDACAAPGNKTTHLAAIIQGGIQDVSGAMQTPMIYACERDKSRASTLEQMVRKAGAQGHTIIKPSQDFLRTDPSQPPWKDVGALLLDPSCSGSGIPGRDETLEVVLPSQGNKESSISQSKKRKRKYRAGTNAINIQILEVPEEISVSESEPPDQLYARLTALSTFQLKLLLHAFEFPAARKITYSTCSIYAQENEHVVIRALDSAIAKRRGWCILKRNEQVSGMNAWEVRGDILACKEVMNAEGVEQIAEACIRCDKGTKEGTQGFFVAAFVRDGDEDVEEQPSEEEWEGCSDDDGSGS